MEKEVVEKNARGLEDKNKSLKGSLDQMNKTLRNLEEEKEDLKAENEKLKTQVNKVHFFK